MTTKTRNRRNRMGSQCYQRAFRIPNGIHTLVTNKALEMGIARWDVYGAYMATALLKPSNFRKVEARMRANSGKVVAHPTGDQTHFQAAFVDEDECTRVREAAAALIVKFRPDDMYFAYHVYQIAVWLCLQGEIEVPAAAYERRR